MGKCTISRTVLTTGRPQAMVSACLAGYSSRYDATSRLVPFFSQGVVLGYFLPVCPEMWAGWSAPRLKVSILGGNGRDLLAGRGRLIDEAGLDLSGELLLAVRMILYNYRNLLPPIAYLKEGSPSCGVSDCGMGHEGVSGPGLFSAALSACGVQLVGVE